MQPNPAVRDEAIGEANIAVMRAKSGRPTKGLLLVGRHRTARIAHIDRICKVLNTADVYVVRVRISKGRSLPAVLGSQLQGTLQRMSARGEPHVPFDEALHALAGFVRSLKPKYPDIDISIDLEPEPGIADSGVLEFDLVSLLEAIGAAAGQAGTAYVILIDDMHYIEAEQLSALIAAMHRIAQRELPVILIGAGSPTLRRRVGDAKPYAERMFDFVDLDGRRSELSKPPP